MAWPRRKEPLCPKPRSSWSRAFPSAAFIHVQGLPIHELPTHILLPESWPGTKLERPRQALERQSCPEKEAQVLGDTEGESKLEASPGTLRSCSDLQTLVKFSLHIAPRHPFFSFRERKRPLQTAKKKKITSWQAGKNMYWDFTSAIAFDSQSNLMTVAFLAPLSK